MNINSIRNPLVPPTRQNPRPASADSPAPDTHQNTDILPGTAAEVRQRPARTPAARDVLNDEEKRFFDGLYPNSSGDVRPPVLYSRSGRQPEHSTGTLLDRKG